MLTTTVLVHMAVFAALAMMAIALAAMLRRERLPEGASVKVRHRIIGAGSPTRRHGREEARDRDGRPFGRIQDFLLERRQHAPGTHAFGHSHVRGGRFAAAGPMNGLGLREMHDCDDRQRTPPDEPDGGCIQNGGERAVRYSRPRGVHLG